MPKTGKARPPEDFSTYLATQEPLTIVGGQAVNLWALYYSGVADEYAPFVSRDIDVLGDRETLKKIAAVAGLKPNFFPLKPPNNEVGYIAPKDREDEPVLIEVLRWVNGTSADELATDSVVMGIGMAKVPVRVPSPVKLLKAKLANLKSVNQRGRQDAKHVYILYRLLPHYLDELMAAIRSGNRTEREVVNLLGTLLENVSDVQNGQILRELRLEAAGLFRELPKSEFPKISNFIEHQLKRTFPQY